MATKNVHQIPIISKAGDADELEAEAEKLRRQREALLDRARDLRSDRRQRIRVIAAIAEEIGVSARPLVEAAKAGRLIAWRAGGDERGAIVTTLANVEEYFAGQPAARRVESEPAPVADVYELAVRAARGGR